jgi:hypothetical protein
MSEGGDNSAPPSRWLAEEPQLAQHRAAVIVDPLARQPVIVVERVNSAQLKLYPSARRRQAAPRTEMRASYCDLDDEALGRHVTVLDVDYQVGQRTQELGVIRAHAVAAYAVISPRLIIITRVYSERRHEPVQVMPILASDVLVHDRHTRLSALRLE